MPIKVVCANELDTEILDEKFYLTLLKNILKTQNGIPACTCLDTSEHIV